MKAHIRVVANSTYFRQALETAAGTCRQGTSGRWRELVGVAASSGACPATLADEFESFLSLGLTAAEAAAHCDELHRAFSSFPAERPKYDPDGARQLWQPGYPGPVPYRQKRPPQPVRTNPVCHLRPRAGRRGRNRG